MGRLRAAATLGCVEVSACALHGSSARGICTVCQVYRNMKKKKASPHMKAAFMEVVENQIRDNEPPETRQTFDRLVAEGISEKDAKLYIGQAIGLEIWSTIRYQKEYIQKRYLKNLARLPKEPREKHPD